MKKLSVKLANCYGIKKLERQLDFTSESVFAIYAPNGAMKSSLAQTFKDIADGSESKDRIFPDRVSVRDITDERGVPLPAANVLVITPYSELFGHSERTSTLLVDTKLRREYEQLHANIDAARDLFLAALKQQSGSKRDLAKEISLTFTRTDTGFYKALIRIKEEVLALKQAPFANVPYDVVCDEKVLTVLGTKDFRNAIESYVRQLNELLAKSTYFKQGTFNYYNASTIAKSLAENGFFDAKHSVSLNADKRLEITSKEQLEELIAKEKEGITNDATLRKKFADLGKLMEKNVTVRTFQAYLDDHQELLTKLANIEAFREEVWQSYFYAHLELYRDLLSNFQAVEKRKKEIELEASKQRTQWEKVIDIFNDRFFVPFKLFPKNRISVMLGEEPMLSLAFTFEDGAENVPVEKATLMQALSTGEKKALYVLNIIFEVEVRKKAQQETLFVVDDIADSFDYKNKYAIIQYLQEIAHEPNFFQIIMTHNFDFFRTISSRFVSYPHCLMAFKDSGGLTLNQAAGIKNIFINDWKGNFFSDSKKRIASIPFIRNLIEYTKGEDAAEYGKLTSLLHWKADTATITQRELDSVFNTLFNTQGRAADEDGMVADAIVREAKDCLTARDGLNFENKIVLAVAIRLAAERFMVERIDDSIFSASIRSNQTQKLLVKFKSVFPMEGASIAALDRVILMTPENIHLNSFMYEPILDMCDEHLRKLYGDVVALG
jgi:hypothetical protein